MQTPRLEFLGEVWGAHDVMGKVDKYFFYFYVTNEPALSVAARYTGGASGASIVVYESCGMADLHYTQV